MPMGLWTSRPSLAISFPLALADTRSFRSVRAGRLWNGDRHTLDCGQSDITESAHGLNDWGVKNEYLAFNAVEACATRDMSYALKLESSHQRFRPARPLTNGHLAGRAGEPLACYVS